VVDDEKSVLNSLKRVLESEFRLTLADSALAALKALDQDSDYDLVLCDLVMPGHDGRFLYREASARWPRLEPRFLFLTGGAYGESLKPFAQEMAARTLHKPLRLEELLAAIHSRLAEPAGGEG